MIGAAVVLAVETAKNALKVASGEMRGNELTASLIKDAFLATCSIIGGGTIQAILPIPVLGYMAGSFLGAVIGSVSFQMGEKILIGLCVETGITFFGLVDQNYRLPEEVLVQIGIVPFKPKEFAYKTFEYKKFTPNSFRYDKFKFETFDIKPLNRGLVGVKKVGYV